MKVKLDENIPRSARQVLIAAGHEVDTVVDENSQVQLIRRSWPLRPPPDDC